MFLLRKHSVIASSITSDLSATPMHGPLGVRQVYIHALLHTRYSHDGELNCLAKKKAPAPLQYVIKYVHLHGGALREGDYNGFQ